MKTDFLPRSLRGFLLRFALLFGLLILPWPGWHQAYGAYFRAFAQRVFEEHDGQRRMAFAPVAAPGDPFDTRISMGNRALLDADGKGLLMRTEVDSRSIGWIPTALTLALIVATPIAWSRRIPALAAGLVLVHVFIALTLQTWIWDNSPGVSLLTLSASSKWVADQLQFAFLNQLGASFTVPVLIWVVVTFQRQDVRLAS
jgi:hypothetical protein